MTSHVGVLYVAPSHHSFGLPPPTLNPPRLLRSFRLHPVSRMFCASRTEGKSGDPSRRAWTAIGTRYVMKSAVLSFVICPAPAMVFKKERRNRTEGTNESDDEHINEVIVFACKRSS